MGGVPYGSTCLGVDDDFVGEEVVGEGPREVVVVDGVDPADALAYRAEDPCRHGHVGQEWFFATRLDPEPGTRTPTEQLCRRSAATGITLEALDCPPGAMQLSQNAWRLLVETDTTAQDRTPWTDVATDVEQYQQLLHGEANQQIRPPTVDFQHEIVLLLTTQESCDAERLVDVADRIEDDGTVPHPAVVGIFDREPSTPPCGAQRGRLTIVAYPRALLNGGPFVLQPTPRRPVDIAARMYVEADLTRPGAVLTDGESRRGTTDDLG